MRDSGAQKEREKERQRQRQREEERAKEREVWGDKFDNRSSEQILG